MSLYLSLLIRFLILGLAVQVGHAFAGPGKFVGGRFIQADYNSCGLWNNPDVKRGFVGEDCCSVDATFPGNPWQQLTVSYIANGQQYFFTGNTLSDCNYTVTKEEILDDGTGLVGIRHYFEMGLIDLIKTETWDFRARTVAIQFEVRYPLSRCAYNCGKVMKLRVMHAVDPDQDRNPFSTFRTYNDVLLFKNYKGHYAQAVGPISCNTLAYAICPHPQYSGVSQDVGFTTWSTSPLTTLTDPKGKLQDITLHYRYYHDWLKCGQSETFHFLVVWGGTQEAALDNFRAAFPKHCQSCAPLDIPPVHQLPQCLCKNICPCECEGGLCDCKTKLERSNFYYPELSWFASGGSRRRRDVNSTAAIIEVSVAALAAANSSFSRSATDVSLTEDEDLAFSRSLDMLVSECPKALTSDLETFWGKLADLSDNAKMYYDDYMTPGRCPD